MKPRVYVETSVISYLTSRPSENLRNAARQLSCRLWWELRGSEFDPFISRLVLDEASRGDPAAAERRLAICEGVALLSESSEARQLAERLILTGAVPPTDPEDAMHIAIATVEQMDFVATLNFAHFASPSAKFRLQMAISELGYRPPLLASPDELLESENDE